MRQDPRRFPASCVLRVDGKPVRIQLSPAEIYGGPEGAWRVRVNKRWHDGVDGLPLYLDRAGLAEILAGLLAAGPVEPAPCPGICANMRVRVWLPGDGELDVGEPVMGWTYSEPILAHDGCWYVLVSAGGRRWYARCEDVTPLPARYQAGPARQWMKNREEQ